MKPSLPSCSEERVCNMEQRVYLKRCSNSSLAETVVNTEELLTEILVRVPARPLVRFKCVSKHWLSLISDPNFCNRHTLQNPPPLFPNTSKAFNSFVPLGLDHDPNRNSNHGSQNLSESASGSGSSICNPLNFVPHLHDTWIIQSCNGLFFCSPLPRIINTPYYVLNPTTNHFKTLIPPATGQECLLGYALVFDPSKSPHYKVLFLWSINEPQGNYCSEYHVQVYSSETRSWRLVGSSFPRLPFVDYKQVVYCNGAVHWVGIDNEISYYHVDEERVRHVFSLPPTNEQSKRKFRYFQESHCGGHLHLIDIYFAHCFTRFEVLEMGRDYSGWFVKYHVDLDHPLTDFSWLEPYQFSVLFLAPEEIEGEVSSSLLLHTPGKVISYNFKSKSFKSFELTPKAGVNDSFLRVEQLNYRYMETLACV